MKESSKGMVPFLSAEAIEELIATIAQKIKNNYDYEDLHFVCPLKGSILFLSDLSRHFHGARVTIDFVKVRTEGRSFVVEKDIETDIQDKNVIIVEEVMDAGRSIAFLKDHLALSRPRNLEVACLLDKPARREAPITPDYVGKTIDDRFVIGYGMDSDEIGRNCADIFNFLQ